MANQVKKDPAPVYVLEEGRLINSALFERDIYKDPDTGAEGKPLYKIEMAFDAAAFNCEKYDVKPGDGSRYGWLEELVVNEVYKEWGNKSANDPNDPKLTVADEFMDHLDGKLTRTRFRSPFLDGNVLAAARKERGKEGTAYEGKFVIRANTTYNKDGHEGPGGINVYGPDAQPVMDASTVFPGCNGVVAVTIKAGIVKATQEHWVKFYLSAFQRTPGGEALKSAAKNPFAPVGNAAAASAASGERRRRVG